MSRGLLVKLALALVCAIVGIVQLEVVLRAGERVSRDVRPFGTAGSTATPAETATANVGIAQPPAAAAISAARDLPDIEATGVRAVDWYVDAQHVVLVESVELAPARAAPVVELLATGGFRVLRPAPLPMGPQRPRSAVAALVLPVARLEALGPPVRAVLLDLLGSWLQSRPVPAASLSARGLEAPRAERQALLGWVR